MDASFRIIHYILIKVWKGRNIFYIKVEKGKKYTRLNKIKQLQFMGWTEIKAAHFHLDGWMVSLLL